MWGKTKENIRWSRMSAAGHVICSSGDKSQGEGRARWGNFGATWLKKLKLISPSQLIMDVAIRAPPAHLLLCPWGICQSQSWSFVLPAQLLGGALWAWPGETAGGLMESWALGIDLDGPVQYLQFSHKGKERMWLSQGHRDSWIERKEEIFIFTDVAIHSLKRFYWSSIMSAGHHRSHKATLHS